MREMYHQCDKTKHFYCYYAKRYGRTQAFSGYKNQYAHPKTQMKQELQGYIPALALRFSRISSWSQGCVKSKILCPVNSTWNGSPPKIKRARQYTTLQHPGYLCHSDVGVRDEKRKRRITCVRPMNLLMFSERKIMSPSDVTTATKPCRDFGYRVSICVSSFSCLLKHPANNTLKPFKYEIPNTYITKQKFFSILTNSPWEQNTARI